VLVLGPWIVAPRVRAELDNGLSERRQYWSTAVRDIGDRPITGHGLDSFGDRWFRLRPAELATTNTNPGGTHDVPLDMAVGGGLPLMGLYLAVVGVTGIRLLRGLRTTAGERRLLLAGVGGAWLAYQLQSLVSLDLPALLAAHWVLTGAVLALTAGTARARPLPRAMPLVAGVLAVAALVLATRPLRAELRLAEAGEAEQAGRGEAALAAYRGAAALAWWEPVYQSYLAVRLPDPASVAAAVRAAELAPGDPFVASRAADIAAAAGDADVERRWRDAAIRNDPRNPRWQRR
jgi:phage tail protein X